MSWRALPLFAICLAAFGCGGRSYEQTDPVYLKDSNLVCETHNAVDALLRTRRDSLDTRDVVVVASVVDVNNLRATTAFGRMLSEMISTRRIQRGYAVTETRTRADSISIDRSGQFILSQDVKDLVADYNARGLMIGTYAVGADRVFVTLRLVDAKNMNASLGGIDYTLWLGPRTAELLGTEPARLPDVAALPYFPRVGAELWGRGDSHDGR